MRILLVAALNACGAGEDEPRPAPPALEERETLEDGRTLTLTSTNEESEITLTDVKSSLTIVPFFLKSEADVEISISDGGLRTEGCPREPVVSQKLVSDTSTVLLEKGRLYLVKANRPYVVNVEFANAKNCKKIYYKFTLHQGT